MATDQQISVNGQYPTTTSTKLKLDFVPFRWQFGDVHQLFSKYGGISRIELQPDRFNRRHQHGWLEFIPGLDDKNWLIHGVEYSFNGFSGRIRCREIAEYQAKSPLGTAHVPIDHIDVGVLQAVDKVVSNYAAESKPSTPPRLSVNKAKKCLEFEFGLSASSTKVVKVSTHLNQIKTFASISNNDHHKLLVTLDAPPFVYESDMTLGIDQKFGSKTWLASKSWRRKANIIPKESPQSAPISLQSREPLIDVGRWLTYVVTMSNVAFESPQFEAVKYMLAQHGVSLQSNLPFEVVHGSSQGICEDGNRLYRAPLPSNNGLSSINDLHQLNASAMADLHFRTHYQLEVCLSQHVLHECNLSSEFMAALADSDKDRNKDDPMAATRASRLLEKAVETGHRLYDPFELFSLIPVPSRSKIPRHCTLLPAATVTPTTVYYSSPNLETSNRVLRQYWKHADRFLRVKFSDERYFGRPMSVIENDTSRDEIFERIERTMNFGIVIADRHYEFLAFANSQFRENSAWFFASTSTLTAAKIRDWMGDFTHIPVVAKYISRLGQCLSTTRAMSIKVAVEKIPDIVRNGFTFTDGVGKISPFLAQMVARELKLRDAANYPSVFQFRLGGCKGILAVDPNLKGVTVQIRPSQEKFAAPFHGLEICRVSNFSSASLNSQVIMVLSALGVPDNIFVDKLKVALEKLATAMDNESVAREELTSNVDPNGTSMFLVDMIKHGFMASGEPFFLSCLHLWRSWMVKHLKDKAHIFVEQGAFVLACVDEIGVLQGHSDPEYDLNMLPIGDQSLPEIFIQISENHDNSAPYKIIEGVCLLMRNPSLHPGDARVVRAVNRKELHHLKNCVIFPQVGDRDLANMCSGGDLDGDDYLVIWDHALLPPQQNHKPMDYYASAPLSRDGPITVEDMTSFFVEYMKHNNLTRIAVAHRYWADYLDDGVKSNRCLALADLHSTAVDYAKSGVPAAMPQELFVRKWPHWSQAKNKSGNDIYHSKKVLGQLFDAVEYVPFQPEKEFQFDSRIIQAFELDQDMLSSAKELKHEYDSALRRLMTRHGIETEFEAWTTFVLQHNAEWSAYRFAEKYGEEIAALKGHFIAESHTRAGVEAEARDEMEPFVAAMYVVTANEVACHQANASCNENDKCDIADEKQAEISLPFMSFPWLFAEQLGQIAKSPTRESMPLDRTKSPSAIQRSDSFDLTEHDQPLPPIETAVFNSAQPQQNEVSGSAQDLCSLRIE